MPNNNRNSYLGSAATGAAAGAAGGGIIGAGLEASETGRKIRGVAEMEAKALRDSAKATKEFEFAKGKTDEAVGKLKNYVSSKISPEAATQLGESASNIKANLVDEGQKTLQSFGDDAAKLTDQLNTLKSSRAGQIGSKALRYGLPAAAIGAGGMMAMNAFSKTSSLSVIDEAIAGQITAMAFRDELEKIAAAREATKLIGRVKDWLPKTKGAKGLWKDMYSQERAAKTVKGFAGGKPATGMSLGGIGKAYDTAGSTSFRLT